MTNQKGKFTKGGLNQMAVFILSVILLVVMGIGVVLSLVTENKMMAALFGVLESCLISPFCSFTYSFCSSHGYGKFSA